MANFVTNLISELRAFISLRVVSIALHSVMLSLCIVGSVVFVVDFLQPPTRPSLSHGFLAFWSV